MADDAEPAPVDFVRLISAEGHVFHVNRKAACMANTIKTMLESNFQESANNTITFQEISTPILEKTIQYCHYKVRYENSSAKIPEFVIEPEIALELLMCSNYLDL
ncbi:hypothetical protein ScalyP_jg2461 [Parmales sp. scaly parma]|nr:hypothetical protein ScalyP_jg2461 [Parmales sp. scaly parma]